jgi:hypothetical protein
MVETDEPRVFLENTWKPIERNGLGLGNVDK